MTNKGIVTSIAGQRAGDPSVEAFSDELKAQMARIQGQPSTAKQKMADDATLVIANLKRQRLLIEAGMATALRDRKDRAAASDDANTTSIGFHEEQIARIRDIMQNDARLLEADVKAIEGQFNQELFAVDQMLDGQKRLLESVTAVPGDNIPY